MPLVSPTHRSLFFHFSSLAFSYPLVFSKTWSIPISPFHISKRIKSLVEWSAYHAAIGRLSSSAAPTSGVRCIFASGPWEDVESGQSPAFPLWIEVLIKERMVGRTEGRSGVTGIVRLTSAKTPRLLVPLDSADFFKISLWILLAQVGLQSWSIMYGWT